MARDPPACKTMNAKAAKVAKGAAVAAHLIATLAVTHGGQLCDLSTVFHNYGDVFSDRSCHPSEFLGFEFGQEFGQIRPGKGPLKGPPRLLVPGLERKEPIVEFAQRREVVRRDDLALDNREVDFDLIQ